MTTSLEVQRPREIERSQCDPAVVARLGMGILDFAQGDYVGMKDVGRFSFVNCPHADPRYAARKLLDILGKRLPNKEAWAMWDEIERYRKHVSADNHTLPFAAAAREWYRLYGRNFEKAWWLNAPLERRYFRTGREDSACGRMIVLFGVALPQLRPLIGAGFTSDQIGAFITKHKAETWRLLVLRRGQQAEFEHFMITMIAVLAGFYIADDQRAAVEAEIDAHRERMAQPQPHTYTGTDYVLQKNAPHITRLDAALDYFKRLEMAGLDALIL